MERFTKDDQKHLRVLIDSLMEGLQVITSDWRYVYVNDSVAKHARKTKADLLGRTMMEVFPGIEKTPMFELLKECMEQRVNKRMENEFTYPDGSSGWFELSMEPVEAGVAILSIDITQRKIADLKNKHLTNVLKAIRNVNQLITRERKKDHLLQRICDNLIQTRGYDQAWIVLVGPEGKPLTAIESGTMTGHKPIYSRIQAGKTIDCMNFALARPGVLVIETSSGSCKQCFKEKVHTPCRLMLDRLEDGDSVYGVLGVHLPLSMPISDEERSLFNEVAGDISHALYVLSVETEKDRSVTALRDSEANLHLVFDSINDAVFYQTLDGRIKDVNKSLCMSLGYTRDELLKMKIQDLITNEGLKGIEDGLKIDAPRVFEAQLRRKDGSMVPSEISTRVINLKGQDVVLCVSRDISERKRAEGLLRQREKIEILGFLASAIPAFASGISPEIRNRLIATFAGLFERNMRPRFYDYLMTLSKDPTSKEGQPSPEQTLLNYLVWISDLFTRFGIDVTRTPPDQSVGFDLLSCPWAEQSKGNPVFCLICRTMVIRSHSWLDLRGDVKVETTIANGGERCVFRISKGEPIV